VQESRKLADVISEPNPEFLLGNEALGHRSGQVFSVRLKEKIK